MRLHPVSRNVFIVLILAAITVGYMLQRLHLA